MRRNSIFVQWIENTYALSLFDKHLQILFNVNVAKTQEFIIFESHSLLTLSIPTSSDNPSSHPSTTSHRGVNGGMKLYIDGRC